MTLCPQTLTVLPSFVPSDTSASRKDRQTPASARLPGAREHQDLEQEADGKDGTGPSATHPINSQDHPEPRHHTPVTLHTREQRPREWEHEMGLVVVPDPGPLRILKLPPAARRKVAEPLRGFQGHPKWEICPQTGRMPPLGPWDCRPVISLCWASVSSPGKWG